MPNNEHEEDWDPMEIEGGSPLTVKVTTDAFKVYTQTKNKKKLVCELQKKKLDIKSMVVSSPDSTKGPKPYSRKPCYLKLKSYTKKVDVTVTARKVMITTPLTGWEKADFCNVWVSTDGTGKPPNVTVESIKVVGGADLKGYKKVNYWYKKVK